MKSPSISVLIAAHNAERTVVSAIQSSLRSLDNSDEVLVMLDACTDQTAEKVGSIHDPRLRIFESHTNLGRSEARNKLAEHAKNKFISILDADDLSLPWRYAITRKFLESHDAVFGTAILFGKLRWPVPFAPQPPVRLENEKIYRSLLEANPLVHSSATYNLEKISGQILYKDIVAEEYELWMRMALSDFRMIRLGLPIVAYRVHPSQASADPDFYSAGLRCKSLKETRRLLSIHLTSHSHH